MDLSFAFDFLNSRLSRLGKQAYCVGGSVRDFLLGLPFDDFDFALPLYPEEVLRCFPEADARFRRYGSFQVAIGGRRIDLTCFRREGDYLDHRHPGKLEFGVDMAEDSKRRDFTVNALYLDASGNVYDFHQGLSDLASGLIRFIGDPRKRIEEDPLRIERAYRFKDKLGFSFDAKTGEEIETLRGLLANINPDKLRMEGKKR